MLKKWELEITRVIMPKGDRSRVLIQQFEVNTIREAKERADDIFKSLIEQDPPSPPGALNTGALGWIIDSERNFIQKGYVPQRSLITAGGTEIQNLHKYYTRIEPIGISLSEISDYAETQQV